jgi:hypothetical protein
MWHPIRNQLPFWEAYDCRYGLRENSTSGFPLDGIFEQESHKVRTGTVSSTCSTLWVVRAVPGASLVAYNSPSTSVLGSLWFSKASCFKARRCGLRNASPSGFHLDGIFEKVSHKMRTGTVSSTCSSLWVVRAVPGAFLVAFISQSTSVLERLRFSITCSFEAPDVACAMTPRQGFLWMAYLYRKATRCGPGTVRSTYRPLRAFTIHHSPFQWL